MPNKDARAAAWAVDATVSSGVRWSYLRVDQDVFDTHESRVADLGQLVDVVFEIRRQQYLRQRRAPRARSQEEVLALMDRIRERTRDVTGVDEELRRIREDPP